MDEARISISITTQVKNTTSSSNTTDLSYTEFFTFIHDYYKKLVDSYVSEEEAKKAFLAYCEHIEVPNEK